MGFRDTDEILEDILGENPTPDQIRDLPDLLRDIESGLERQFASAFERLNGRVTAVNASFGLPGNIEDFDAEALRGRFPNVIEAIAQADTQAAERTVYVWAAGNSNGEVNPDGSVVSATSVDIAAGLPVRIPELRGHSLAVVATDRQGRIAGFSSRCGIAKEFCLAAPGVDVTGPVPGFYCANGAAECYPSLEESGTSSAAPFVTGGIGLLAEHFRNQLGNDEIAGRMLATADRAGEYANSDVYGRGFLDLDAATRPEGGTRMLTGRSLAGPSTTSVNSVFHLGGPSEIRWRGGLPRGTSRASMSWTRRSSVRLATSSGKAASLRPRLRHVSERWDATRSGRNSTWRTRNFACVSMRSRHRPAPAVATVRASVARPACPVRSARSR